jgi:hypothetical protein
LIIPGMGPWESAYADANQAYADANPEIIAVAPGQGVLFSMPPVVPRGAAMSRPSPTQLGASGHSIFKGHVMSRGLNLQESPDPGHAGDDCWVEGKWVQIKTTSILQSDGRLVFTAGKRKRFDRYATIDFFAFVVINVPGLHARIRIMEGGIVRNRWPGQTVHLLPTDFPSDIDLRLLEPVVTDAMFDELIARSMNNA